MKILAGIASVKPDERFLRDIQLLFENTSHEVEVSWVRGKKLVDAQNDLASQLLASDHEALLLLEEDHWGHTTEMLDDLVKAEADVSAIGYYSRWRHLPLTLMERRPYHDPVNNYFEVVTKDKYHEVDLCGFGMTLIQRSVFSELGQPFFQLNGNTKRNIATDKNFCERVKGAGLKIVGVFDHDLVHAGISKENAAKKRIAFQMNYWRTRAVYA